MPFGAGALPWCFTTCQGPHVEPGGQYYICSPPCRHSHRLPYLSPSSAPAQLNDPAAQDTQIEAAVSEVVERLFCVLATLGVVPIIRCPRGGAAEHVAAQVGGGWQQEWRQTGQAGRERPTLLRAGQGASRLQAV